MPRIFEQIFGKFAENPGQIFDIVCKTYVKYEEYFKSFAALSHSPHVVALPCWNCVYMLLRGILHQCNMQYAILQKNIALKYGT